MLLLLLLLLFIYYVLQLLLGDSLFAMNCSFAESIILSSCVISCVYVCITYNKYVIHLIKYLNEKCIFATVYLLWY